MAELLLDSLEVENFRAFKHLKIEKLGRVNLIVGKNSVGKTALLEALWLYANRGSFKTVIDILNGRKEINHDSVKDLKIEDEENILVALKQLFHGRKNFKYPSSDVTVGSIFNKNKGITFGVSGNNRLDKYDDKKIVLYLETGDIPNLNYSTYGYFVNSKEIPKLHMTYSIEKGVRIEDPETEGGTPVGNFISVAGLTDSKLNELWGKIALTEFENDIVKALRIIIPGIERIAIITHAGSYSKGNSILVKIENDDNRVVLRSLGDGLTKVFGIALALVNSKDGMLLIDEIENGLHFTTQLGLWRLIFAIARRLNVQVFATTHSWDCIQAFQKAASEDPEQGMLIRLDKVRDEIVPVLVDEERLAILTREQIEVR